MTQPAPHAPLAVAVLVAAGAGRRMGGAEPKQFQPLGAGDVLSRALGALTAHPGVGRVAVVLPPGSAAIALPPECLRVEGGATRQASVAAGLAALAADGADDDAVVLVHDAARPLLAADLVDRAIGAGAAGAAVPVLPLADLVKRVGADGAVEATLDRAALRAVQTPQAFRLGLLRRAHAAAAAAGARDLPDDAAAVERLGLPVTTFPGDPRAFKLTTPEDRERARALVAPARVEARVGTGFDVHAFGPGDHVVLAGLEIPFERGLLGHSDADVALHALTDALLGAIGDGDIGQHFPPSDPRWRGADSAAFLEDAARRVRARGGRIVHLDATIICEAPKVGPHREAMRARIAAIAGVAPHRVGVKATTSERLGFTGRGEGIAAMASASVELPRVEDD